MTTTTATRNSLPSLWEQAVTLWNELVMSFGNSALLMRWGWMRALEHRALRHWLRDLEKLVRRAIRADAEDLDLPPLRPRAPRPRRQSNETTQSVRAEPDLPATWQACFHMQPARSGKRGSRKSKEPAEQRPCRGYAVRIEALRRVICDPDAYVLRYARRLARIDAANIHALTKALKVCEPPQPTPAAAPSEAAPRSAKHIEPG